MIVVGLMPRWRDEIPRPRMLVCVRLLEVDKVIAGRLQKPLSRTCRLVTALLERRALSNKRRTKQVGKANSAEPAPRQHVR